MNSLVSKPYFDRALHWTSLGAGILLLMSMLAMSLSIVDTSMISIDTFGFNFLFSTNWDPAQAQFGAAAIITGTVLTTLIALVLAVPLSVLTAVSLAHLLPKRMAAVLGMAVEVMAAIPSIIYGIWALFVLAPFLGEYVYPYLLEVTENVPVLNQIFAGLPIGTNIMTASIVLAIMIYPLMTAMMRDVFNLIPDMLIEASYGAGLTTWQIVRHIFVHYSRAGLLGSIVLGLTRAFGETMAVTFVIGNAHEAFSGLLMPGSTIASTIANEFSEASTPLYVSSLFAVRFIVIGAFSYYLVFIQGFYSPW